MTKPQIDPEMHVYTPPTWSRESPASVPYTLRMQETVRDQLQALADAYNISRSQMLQALVAREYADVFTTQEK